MEKREELEKVLEDLGSVGDVLGAAIVRRDGLLIASRLPQNVNAGTVSAMAAAIVGTSETSAKELSIGDFSQVIVNASSGQYVSIGAGAEAILIVLLKKGANLGLALLEMVRSSKKVARLID